MKLTPTGLIVAAAFIGPGTITTASMVGASQGYGLLWALIFSIIATCILQEMAGRLGQVSQKGLSEAIIKQCQHPVAKGLAIILVFCAIAIGNAAYEGGNISGAALGLNAMLGLSHSVWAIATGCAAAVLLVINKFVLLERVLMALVVVMSVVFISMMFVSGIDLPSLYKGITEPTGFSEMTLLLAIIGTTIVPYNLFLHASLSAQHAKQGRFESNSDLFYSIGLGGLITVAIMSTSVTAFFVTAIEPNPQNLADQLAPLLGAYAQIFFALGLFAAGLTSAITAPLAAAYAVAGLFSWQPNLQNRGVKFTALAIVIFGTLVAASGIKPLEIIILAQASNALLLPISAIFLVVVMNNRQLMQTRINTPLQNILALAVLAIVITLGATRLWQIIN